MNSSKAQQKKLVLSCIDGSTVTTPVCDYSSWIAGKIKAPVKLLHTIEHSADPMITDYSGAIGLGTSEELLNELTELEQNRSRLLIKKGELMLNAAKERIEEQGIADIQQRQRHGSLTEALIDLEDQIDVLVMGIRGEEHADDETGVGTQLETVVRSLHRPILVVNRDFKTPEKVMLAYDGSEACKKALELIADSQLFIDIPCHVVHVGDNSESLLNDAANILTKAGKEVVTAELSGNIEDALIDYQRKHDIDLTIMGAFSHNRFRGFLLGSFTSRMLNKTRRPLLLLR